MLHQTSPSLFSPYESINRKQGFLTHEMLSTTLPPVTALNIQLNELVITLPKLIKKNQLRNKINTLNQTYQHTKIQIDYSASSQKKTAFLILLFLTQAYLFEKPKEPVNKLPGVLANNLQQLSQLERRLPTLTYADYILHNWRFMYNLDEFEVENIQPLFTFTDTFDEKWFIKIHVATEAACGEALHAAYQACVLATFLQKRDFKLNSTHKLVLTNWLTNIAESLQKATNINKRMAEGVRPHFLEYLQLFFKGTDTIKFNDQIPGITMEVSASQNPAWHAYKGFSCEQSGILPALEAALGIAQTLDCHYQKLTYERYLPRKDRLFIKTLEKNSLVKLINKKENFELKKPWSLAVAKLKLFRSAFVGFTTEYCYYGAPLQNIISKQFNQDKSLDNNFLETHTTNIKAKL